MSALLNVLSQISTFRLNKESTACCCFSKCYAKLLLIETNRNFHSASFENDSQDSLKKKMIGFMPAVEITLYRSQPKVMDDKASTLNQ